MKKKIMMFMSMLLFLACNNKEGDKVAKSNKPVEIEYWHVASETFGGPSVKKIVDDFNSTHPDIKVIEKFNPDMYKGLTQNLQIALASGKTPAIVQMGYSFLNYANDNFQFTSPQDIIDKYYPEDTNFFNDNFKDNILDLGRTNGRQVGIPYSISNPIVYMNLDLIAKSGMDTTNLPKTWDEIKKTAYKVHETTGNYGLFMQEYNDNWAQQAMMEGAGARVLETKNGKPHSNFATDESAKLYQSLADMVKDSVALHTSNDQAFQAFLNGKVAMVITTVGKRKYFQSNAKFNLKAEKFPIYKNYPRRVPAGGNFLMILAKDEAKQKAAWEFMKYVYSPKALEEWSKGTGYIPGSVKENTSLSKFIETNQIMSVAASQFGDVVKWASFPGANGLEAEQILIDTRDIILSSQEPASKALKDAQNRINKIIEGEK